MKSFLQVCLSSKSILGTQGHINPLADRRDFLTFATLGGYFVFLRKASSFSIKSIRFYSASYIVILFNGNSNCQEEEKKSNNPFLD